MDTFADYTFANRIRVATSTTGIGTLTLGTPLIDMQGFSGNVPDGALVSYTIEDGPLAWEVGSGTYHVGVSGAADTLTRDLVESSTNANALIVLSGNANVYITPSASWLNNLQERVGTVLVQDTPPVGAHINTLWWDSAGTGLYVNYDDGNSIQWVLSENQSNIAGVLVGDTPPTNATENTLWWDSTGTGLYVKYNDGTSTQWVVAQNQNTLTDAPSDGNTYGRYNSTWKNLAAGGAGALPFLPLSGVTPMTGPLNYTATGGTTVRSAQDRAAELVNVRDFGAKGDGTTNDTAAFNAAMGVAYNSPHACIVTIPSGLYLLDPLLVPDSVVLQGVVPGPLDPTTGFLTTPIGATLLVNSHAREFITLAGRSGLHDVIIYDPGQVAPTATAPNVYPATVFMNAVCRVSGLTICNAYDGIWVRSGRCWVENCYIGAYHTAVDIDSCADATYLNNIFCSVFYDTCLGLFPWQNMDNWVMNNNGVAFKFGRADAVSMMNCVAFIKWCGIFINDGTGPNPGQAYGSCANFHVDTCVYGAIIYSTNASAGWQFSNFTALPTNGAPQPNSITPLAMPTGGVSAPHVGWTGGAIGFSAAKWSNPAPIVNAGWLQVVNVNLLTDGVVTPSMDGTAAVGTSLVLAKADHVHPTDTSRLARSGGTMSGQLTMANQQPFRFTDASGSTATGFVLQSDNNFVLAGSSSTGAARNIASMVQHSDTSTFNWIAPVIFGATATFNVNSGFANGIWLEWFDTGGAAALMGLMPDNTLNWYGTNATGAVRLIMQMQQRSSTSAAGWSVPMQFISTVGFNNTAPIAKPTVAGACAGNTAIKALLTALASYGLVTDSTTA